MKTQKRVGRYLEKVKNRKMWEGGNHRRRVSPKGRLPLCGKRVQKGAWGIPKIKFTTFKILPRVSPIPRKELFLHYSRYMAHNCYQSPDSYCA